MHTTTTQTEGQQAGVRTSVLREEKQKQRARSRVGFNRFLDQKLYTVHILNNIGVCIVDSVILITLDWKRKTLIWKEKEGKPEAEINRWSVLDK